MIEECKWTIWFVWRLRSSESDATACHKIAILTSPPSSNTTLNLPILGIAIFANISKTARPPSGHYGRSPYDSMSCYYGRSPCVTVAAHRGSQLGVNTMLCPIKSNCNTIELTVLTSCYWVLDLLCFWNIFHLTILLITFIESVNYLNG